MSKNILLIVEGEADEAKFFKRLYEECFNCEHHIFSYRSNIHVLAQELYSNYPNFEKDEIDIKLVLASLEQDKDRKELLLAKYTDVYLVFDFDPQHENPHFDTVRRMMLYFCDSTSQGKLYLNYPMMQSYKHFSKLPDAGFKTLEVDYSDVKGYKRLVGNVSNYTDLTQYKYDTFHSIAAHHIMKANYLINGRYELPSCDEYLKTDLTKLYDYELRLFNEERIVSVINTCIFVLCDYNPTRFFETLSRKKDNFLL